LKASPLPIHFAGAQVRDFTYIDDILEALVCAASAERLRFPVYNVCSSVPVTVQLAAETIADTLGAARELLHFGALPYRPDDDSWLVGDN
jgi:UDP-glucose 4-epimerase